MGTTSGVGTGFTKTSTRLNVMFSRHKCGLTVFGDIDVVKNAAGYKPKSGRVDQYDEETHTRKFVSVKDIEKCHDWFVERGRVGETRQQLEAKDKKRKEDEEARKNKPAPTKGGGAKNKGPKGTKGSKGKGGDDSAAKVVEG